MSDMSLVSAVSSLLKAVGRATVVASMPWLAGSDGGL